MTNGIRISIEDHCEKSFAVRVFTIIIKEDNEKQMIILFNLVILETGSFPFWFNSFWTKRIKQEEVARYTQNGM